MAHYTPTNFNQRLATHNRYHLHHIAPCSNQMITFTNRNRKLPRSHPRTPLSPGGATSPKMLGRVNPALQSAPFHGRRKRRVHTILASQALTHIHVYLVLTRSICIQRNVPNRTNHPPNRQIQRPKTPPPNQPRTRLLPRQTQIRHGLRLGQMRFLLPLTPETITSPSRTERRTHGTSRSWK